MPPTDVMPYGFVVAIDSHLASLEPDGILAAAYRLLVRNAAKNRPDIDPKDLFFIADPYDGGVTDTYIYVYEKACESHVFEAIAFNRGG